MTACAGRDRLLVVAHPWRGHPPIQRVALPLAAPLGKIGVPRLARIYGMGGRHGGNELFLDLAPHFFDFLWAALWPARLVPGARHPGWTHQRSRRSAPRSGGDGARRGQRHHHLLRLRDLSEAHFKIVPERRQGSALPLDRDVHGTAGTLSLPGPMSNQPDIYFHPLVNPPRGDEGWEVIPADPPPDAHKWVRAHHRE